MSNRDHPNWKGYLRPDGRKGVRNLVLVIYTVECAKHVAHAIAEGEPDVHVIGFPGCYDNQYAIRLMLALARHPNVGAVLAVGLGCEYTQPEKIAEVVPRAAGRPNGSSSRRTAARARASRRASGSFARLRDQIRPRCRACR